MAIKIKKTADGCYEAVVTPPNGNRPWQTQSPLSIDVLIDKLKALGCHQTDIGDAFYEADPDWLSNPG